MVPRPRIGPFSIGTLRPPFPFDTLPPPTWRKYIFHPLREPPVARMPPDRRRPTERPQPLNRKEPQLNKLA